LASTGQTQNPTIPTSDVESAGTQPLTWYARDSGGLVA